MSDEEYNKIIYAKLHKVMRSYKEGVINLFKEEKPDITEDEIKEKMTGVIGANFDVIYLISQN